MPLFETTNPSDAYTLEGELLPCAVATLLLGEGRYGLRGKNGEQAMPIFLFGGHETWLKEQGIEGELTAYLEAHRAEVVAALETVMIGDARERARMTRILAVITDADEREKAKLAWHDERRSSLNDIGALASAMAKRLRDPV